MATFREIDMSIGQSPGQPAHGEGLRSTAEEILDVNTSQSEAEEAESKGRLGFVYTKVQRQVLRQLCDDANNSVLIENNAIHLKN